MSFQLDRSHSLALAVGLLLGLQKHEEIQELLEKVLGKAEAERFTKDLFKIADGFYV